MVETRKLAAILAADVAGYSKLAGADEERTLARLRALRSDLIDPTPWRLHDLTSSHASGLSERALELFVRAPIGCHYR
jgi:hypothetical protein